MFTLTQRFEKKYKIGQPSPTALQWAKIMDKYEFCAYVNY